MGSSKQAKGKMQQMELQRQVKAQVDCKFCKLNLEWKLVCDD